MFFPKPVIIGKSPAILKNWEIIKKVAGVNLSVLITGESGVGKELVARALHYYSDRKEKIFLKLNCAALPAELAESELFGYEKGAFTGAENPKLGKFELAAGGTIFLDEISEMPLSIQAKFLQVLQDGKFSKVGGCSNVTASARVIAATNRNIEEAIVSGAFRADLFYRINTITINVPPLRERKEDIPLLVDYFLNCIKQDYGLSSIEILPEFIKLFYEYCWPGNVRQLENYLKRLCVLGNADDIKDELQFKIKQLSDEILSSIPPDNLCKTIFDPDTNKDNRKVEFPSLKVLKKQALFRIEKEAIKQALIETSWNRKRAAEILKISYRSLLYKLKSMNIKP